jgi:hypothetical protein
LRHLYVEAATFADATHAILNKLEGYSHEENCKKVLKVFGVFLF